MTTRRDKRTGRMGKLHDLLSDCFPKRRNEGGDFIDVKWLAGKLGMSEEGVYKYFRRDKIPAKRVRQIVKLSGFQGSFEDFIDYLL